MFGDVISDPQNCGEFNKNRDKGRKPSLENQNVPKRKQQIHAEAVTPPKDQKGEQLKKQEPVLKKQEAVVKKQAAVAKPNKPLSGGSGPGRPTKPGVGQYQTKPQQNSDKVTIQKRELHSQQNVSIINDDNWTFILVLNIELLTTYLVFFPNLENEILR